MLRASASTALSPGGYVADREDAQLPSGSRPPTRLWDPGGCEHDCEDRGPRTEWSSAVYAMVVYFWWSEPSAH